MKPERIVLAERLVLVAGFAAIVAALAAVDGRLGLFTAGLLLVVSTSPWRNLR